MVNGSKIEIVTQTEDGRSSFRAEAFVRREEGALLVSYLYGGDEAVLRAETGALSMHRKGENELFCRFAEGETSSLRLRSLGREGTLPVKTVKYSPTFSAKRFHAVLDYELHGASGIQAFHLTITVFHLPEA